MNNQIHFISQYLATAGKSFLEHRPDDSHTNVGFNVKTKSFETWELNAKQLKLLFDLPNFELKWSTGPSLTLDGKTHAEVVEWLKTSSQQVGQNKTYSFDLHYELPFEWNEGFVFQLDDSKELNRLIALRILANTALTAFLSTEKVQSDIRVWPHHFDTGGFVVLEDGSGKSIGLGMAIPDSLVNDHYFYISGYRGHKSLDTNTFKNLSLGEWKNEGFKGAVLPASSIGTEEAVQFLKEAFQELST